MKRKDRLGVVFSTDPEYSYRYAADEERETLPPQKQDLKVLLDAKNRKGKKVTLITGFVGSDADLEKLAREIKAICGTGGSAKQGEIIIQGDFREKICKYLTERQYKVKMTGG
ncbi:MAG: translation initiation factor [Bacteroidales bacterium]|nr:translation initiation factor [Bacteroidales bacterium]MBN2764045.1 translation initiation factor [Bacteroidales bacterium]